MTMSLSLRMAGCVSAELARDCGNVAKKAISARQKCNKARLMNFACLALGWQRKENSSVEIAGIKRLRELHGTSVTSGRRGRGRDKAKENRSEERRVGKECRSRWSP